MGLRFIEMVVDRIWEKTLKPKEDFLISLSDGKFQKGTIFAVINPRGLWNEQALSQKIGAVVTQSWSPSRERIQAAAKSALMGEIFGSEDDCGPELFNLMHWHGSRDWNISSLTEQDQKKADALAMHTIATRLQLRDVIDTNPPLNLQLKVRAPTISFLVYPMVVKVPVSSMRYFLEIDAAFAFNSIRVAGHPDSDNIISYLYEILFLQQKTALSLLDYLCLAEQVRQEKCDSLLVKAELYGIMRADLLVTYLKASIEKILVLVASVFEIKGLDAQKTHKKKLELLARSLPPRIKNTDYGDFLFEMVKSENLAELNNYRSGLLHKKGIAALQPHNYAGCPPDSLPDIRVFQYLHEQHAKNTAGLLAALAILTDDLVFRAPVQDADNLLAELRKLVTEEVK